MGGREDDERERGGTMRWREGGERRDNEMEGGRREEGQ